VSRALDFCRIILVITGKYCIWPAETRAMGRPRGVPTTRKEFRLEARQVEYFEALRETAALGKPSLVSLARQAVDEFITRELAKRDVRSRVERYLNEHRKIVKLHEVRKDT
jgi:hypothetical protein